MSPNGATHAMSRVAPLGLKLMGAALTRGLHPWLLPGALFGANSHARHSNHISRENSLTPLLPYSLSPFLPYSFSPSLPPPNCSSPNHGISTTFYAPKTRPEI